MNAILLDPRFDDAERRRQLYNGSLLVYSPTPSSLKLCELAQELSEEAFAPHDPEVAQESITVEKYVEILAALKPKFIHHPRAKELIRGVFEDLGCDLDNTYFDVPRLRTMTHGNYLTAGLAYAFHPHRDTWFSAPASQINWWLPVYDISGENTIAFYPRYFHESVPNSSCDYNYYKWNQQSRGEAAKQIKADTRKQPQALVPIDNDAHVRLVCPRGGMILFSGAYMHATVPNTSGRTRFSIDFRTVNLDDVVAHEGAANVDSECTGTTLRDFLRGSDQARLADDVAALYDTQPAQGQLIYAPA